MTPRIPDIAKVRQLIPPLSHHLHKGQAGNALAITESFFEWH
jgi:hypothetical protein